MINEIVKAVYGVTKECAKAVKGQKLGAFEEVEEGLIKTVSFLLENIDASPGDVYASIAGEDDKPFKQIGMKQQVMYYATVAVVREVVALIKKHEAEKEALAKEPQADSGGLRGGKPKKKPLPVGDLGPSEFADYSNINTGGVQIKDGE
jgi:hypothetical protein